MSGVDRARLVEDYEAQRALIALDAPEMVAECTLILRKDDDRPVTVATWTQAMTLLPIVDVVVLAGGEPDDGWRFAIAWSALEARVGATCWRRVPALVPPRVRAHAWPSAAVLRELYEARDSLLTSTASPPP